MTDDRLAEIKGTTYYVADVIVGDINWLVGEIERLRVQWMAEQRDNERLRAENERRDEALTDAANEVAKMYRIMEEHDLERFVHD
jgi:hypothetical protein